MPIVVGPDLTAGAGVDLCAVFLNDAADPTDLQSFEYVGDTLSPTTTSRVEVRQLIGRRRLIRHGDDDSSVFETYAITLPRCTTEEVEWLRDHVGVLLCVRDHKGAKFYGTYAEAPREIQTKFPDRTQVKITVEQVTHSEAV